MTDSISPADPDWSFLTETLMEFQADLDAGRAPEVRHYLDRLPARLRRPGGAALEELFEHMSDARHETVGSAALSNLSSVDRAVLRAKLEYIVDALNDALPEESSG